MHYETRFCTHCATPLQWMEMEEDAGPVTRLRCPACGWTHWNNPTPVLAAIVELDGKVLLARNAAWPAGAFGLITGFMEAGEPPEAGVAREVLEETGLETLALHLVGVYEFVRMNQVIMAWHAQTRGSVRLSSELLEYRLIAPENLHTWPSGTGRALDDWLRARGHEPQVREFFRRRE